MIEDPDLKFMKEYFSETNNKVPLSPLCGLKLVNKMISNIPDNKFRVSFGLYLSGYDYEEIARIMNLPPHEVEYNIRFVKKMLSSGH